MRSRFLIFLFSLFVTFPLFSQDYDLGAYAGLSTSQIHGDNYGGYNQIGLVIGGYYEHSLKKNINLATQLRIVQKGSSSTLDVNSSSVSSYRSRLNYLEVPVVAQYFYYSNIGIEAGLGFSWLINAKENLNGSGYEDASSYFDKTDINLLAGLLYKFSDRISLNAQYSISALPFGARNEVKLYNDAIVFALRYSIKSRD